MHKVLNAFAGSKASLWNPPRVSMAKERKAIPWSLVVASLSSPLHLELKCLLQGNPRLSISTFDWTRVRRPRNGHIKGPVFAVNSASNQDVTWASCNTFYWGKSSIGSSLVENITKSIIDDPVQVLSLPVSAAA